MNIQGTVVFARLYWAGRQSPCDEDGGGNCSATFTPYRDQQMMFNGNPVTFPSRGSMGLLTDASSRPNSASTVLKSSAVSNVFQ